MSAASSASTPAPAGWVIRREPSDAMAQAGAPDGDSGPGPVSESRARRETRIFGLTPGERLRRSLVRAGCRDVRLVTPATAPPADSEVVALREDVILDERIVRELALAPDTFLECDPLGPIGAHVRASDASRLAAALSGDADVDLSKLPLRRVTPTELVPAYVAELRKREPPYAFAARPELAARVEAHAFAASYKGLTDLVTKWVWPRPAAAATRWCARRGIHPNSVTLASWLLAVVAIGLFAGGAFGPGLAVAWFMTFLDTVDGKLARVTLTSSRLGDVLDHGLDLIHPPLWWLAWGVGLGSGHELATAVAVVGYVVGRLLEGAFLAAFGFEVHSWRPIDGLFRTITARRNPNLILLSVATLTGRPDLGLEMVALWTVASLVFHATRLARATARRGRGRDVEPWERA